MKTVWQLLSESLHLCLKHAVTLIVAATFFSGVLVFVYMTLFEAIEFTARSAILSTGVGQERMAELNQRMEEGDQKAFNELLNELELAAGRLGSLEPSERATNLEKNVIMMYAKILPLAFLLYLLTIIVVLISSTLYFVLAIFPSLDGFAALKKSSKVILPMFGIWIWASLRSFVWVPFIGFFFGLYYLPRFAFANAIYLQEKRGILESAKLSFERTRGQWGKIVGNYVILVIILWLTLWLFTMLAVNSGSLTFLLVLMFSQLQLAYAVTFTVLLGESVMGKSTQNIS